MADSARILSGHLASGGRIDKALAQASDLSRERIKALIAQGAVDIGGQVAASASAQASPGDTYTIRVPEPAPAAAAPQAIDLQIAYEDEYLIVVDKPAGMVVHPAAGNADGTLVNALLHHCAGQLSGIGGVARPGIVHRIDKDTSGLIVAAKTDAAHEGLARQFADHSIVRRYLAVVSGQPKPPSGTISGRIGRSDRNRKKMAVLDDKAQRGKHAVTHYATLQRLDGATVVECRLETGRTHQIRVHMASIGHVLLGDPTYGRSDSRIRPVPESLDFRRQALHAGVLGFAHPVNGSGIELNSPVPADMRELIDKLGGSD